MKKIQDLKQIKQGKIKSKGLENAVKKLIEKYDNETPQGKEMFNEIMGANITKTYEMVEKTSPLAIKSDKEKEANKNQKAEQKAKAEKKAQEEKEEEAKKKEAAKPKKLSKEDKTACEDLLDEIGTTLEKRKVNKKPKPTGPKTQKKVSTVLAENISRSFIAPIKKEMTKDKVQNIKIPKLHEAKEFFRKGLLSYRQAIGGISDSNSQMPKKFTAAVDEFIKEIESLQK